VPRLFVALVPPTRVVAPLVEIVDDLRSAAPELAWVQPARWHVTLAFLGEVPDGLRPALGEQLARVARRHLPPRLRLAGAGRFGADVVYLEVDGEVSDLILAVRAAAVGIGITGVDDRTPHPHLTLARARPGQKNDLQVVVDALAKTTGALPADGRTWTADRMSLVRSRAGVSGGYDEQASWSLVG
jgi:2'-5' RNA ligase